VLVAAAVFLAVVLAGSQVRMPAEASRQTIGNRTPDPLPLPTRAGLRLEAARAHQAAGHLREALADLADVEPTDANWREAEALRALIQQQLLSGAGAPVPLGPGGERDGTQP
jgi:hypothetical protein